MKTAEDFEIEAQAEVEELLLIHPEFCADVRIFTARGDSFRTIARWLDNSIRRSLVADNGFNKPTPTGVSNYYQFLSTYDWETDHGN